MSNGGEPLERRAVISGIGQSAIGRSLGRSDLDLTVEACLAAVADAGLTRDDVDGLATYPGMGTGTAGFAGPTSPEVQDALRLRLNWHDGGGEGPGQKRALIAVSPSAPALHAMSSSTGRFRSPPRRGREVARGSEAAGGQAPVGSRDSCSGRCPSAQFPP